MSNIKCLLIEPADNLIKLLISRYDCNKIDDNEIYSNWIKYTLDLYNNRIEFLEVANIKKLGNNRWVNILRDSYKINYKKMRSNFLNLNSNIIDKNNIVINLSNSNINKEYTIFYLLIFIFQYLHSFDDKSININLWNYSLKSFTYSLKTLLIGFFTLISQMFFTGALIYSIFDNFESTKDNTIIAITIISTIVSILYSFETTCSFYRSIPLYKFLIKMYKDYPELELSKEEKKILFYKNRKINMTKKILYYNLICDFFSNFILPFIIPVVNIFIILNSDSIIDAILNSLAIFYIVQIDEELYRVTDYKQDQQTLNFTRWIISVIYCRHTPEFNKVFKLESNNWQNILLNRIKRFKLNKVIPE